jgi:hypothetical protein
MKRTTQIRIPLLALLAVVALVSGASAQESILTGVHASGTVGATYNRDSSERIVGQGIGQEVSTDVVGAIFNPNFISWSSSFSYGHNSASVAGANADTSALAGTFNSMILPASSFPLTITYQRTRVGLGAAGMDTTTNSDHFSLDWRLQFTHLPKIEFRYGNDSTSSDVPVGAFVASDSHGSGMNITATDTWKGWNWTGGWSRNDSTSGAFLIDQPATIEQDYSTLGGEVTRRYLGGRGFFDYNVRRTTNDVTQGPLSDLSGTQFSQSASTSIRPTDKLTTFAAVQFYRFSSQGRIATPEDPSVYTYVLEYPISGYSTTGGVLYRVHRHISVGDTVSYSTADVQPSASEQATAYFNNVATVNGNYTWRQILFSGSYGLGYLQSMTNRDRSLGGMSQNVNAAASWTRPWVTLTGAIGVGRSADGPLPGSFQNGNSYSVTAESSRLPVGRLRLRWLLQNRDLLGFTGYVNSSRNFWSATLIRRHWQVETGMSSGSGAHQVFVTRPVVYDPLPDLFGSLLADQNLDNWYVSGSGELRRNLRINGTYRRESSQIPTTGVTSIYSLYEIHLNYRIGKIVVEASYGRYANMSAFGNVGALHGQESGSATDRFRFRIVRSFNLF